MLEMLVHELLLQKIERNAETPLARQVYEAFSALILDGDLPAGTKLPASRALARETLLSRNTIIAAYEQLQAEGYVVAVTGSGTFVSDTVPVMSASKKDDTDDSLQPSIDETLLLSRRGIELLHHAQASKQQWGAFVPGVPDLRLFPNKTWMRLQRRYWQKPMPDLMTYAHGSGYLPLRQALADHLRIARSVRCEAEQVIITSGIHQSLSVIAKLLGDIDSTAWMENPGYWGASTVLRAAGIRLVPVDVDEEGLSPDAGQMQKPPQFIFVTPSHQYPLGTLMSLGRRRMLLEYAHQRGAWIIEDDYDSEFRFGGRPIASLQGLDSYDRVIYLGTFSKTLFPGIRLGYIVVPKKLASLLSLGMSELYREGRLIDQAVLADFISEGHYSSHVRKMKAVYARRQTLLRNAICSHYGTAWPMSSQEAGLHLVMHLPQGVSDVAITAAAQKRGIWVRPLSNYYSGTKRLPGLLFGYATVNEEDIEPAFKQLAKLIDAELEHSNL
ncbi:PLP-dependent aminotransferase family protein [Paenalcaligenes niemegkensis]|uniref:MocR-like pyridoxine biosynthesis transcription factor PdxR n=1 Tax=Paenalcaligenes niemegkensis TaxID=2895469 RepID=UPI001EE91F9C|nr:PLP-dependent aminotransferase family protein [Paenalcaligenes niemegkensis]MCQ9618156.1 PLP-dependent aminotransferase family protein [Paenalcaligenes niemegkensis]